MSHLHLHPLSTAPCQKHHKLSPGCTNYPKHCCSTFVFQEIKRGNSGQRWANLCSVLQVGLPVAYSLTGWGLFGFLLPSDQLSSCQHVSVSPAPCAGQSPPESTAYIHTQEVRYTVWQGHMKSVVVTIILLVCVSPGTSDEIQWHSLNTQTSADVFLCQDFIRRLCAYSVFVLVKFQTIFVITKFWFHSDSTICTLFTLWEILLETCLTATWTGMVSDSSTNCAIFITDEN